MSIKQKKEYRTILYILCLALAILFSAGCGGRRGHFSFIPYSASVWVRMYLAEIASDAEFAQALSLYELRSYLEQIGVDATKVSKMTVYADFRSQQEGALLTGRYRIKDIVKKLREQGFTRESYLRSKIYRHPSKDEGVAMLYSDTLVLGTIGGVKSVLDVKYGKQKSLLQLPEGRLLLSKFAYSNAPVVMGLLVPQDVLDMGSAALSLGSVALDIMGIGAIGALLQKIGLAEGIGMEMRRKGDEFLVKLLCIMQNEGVASFIAGTLNLLKGIGSFIPPSSTPSAQRDMEALRKMEITREGKVLSITLAMPRQAFIR